MFPKTPLALVVPNFEPHVRHIGSLKSYSYSSCAWWCHVSSHQWIGTGPVIYQNWSSRKGRIKIKTPGRPKPIFLSVMEEESWIDWGWGKEGGDNEDLQIKLKLQGNSLNSCFGTRSVGWAKGGKFRIKLYCEHAGSDFSLNLATHFVLRLQLPLQNMHFPSVVNSGHVCTSSEKVWGCCLSAF